MTSRTRTPPHFKWLLNERAMLAGEVNRREKQIHALSLQLVPLRQKIAALDETMALFDETVRPDAGGVVRAQTGTNEAHGGLTPLRGGRT